MSFLEWWERLLFGQPKVVMEVTPPPSGTGEVVHRGMASSFADPADLIAYKHCKATGRSEEECLAVGDNCIGVWDDPTGQGTGLSCALIPEDIRERWGTLRNGKHRLVRVSANGKTIVCVLKDILGHHKGVVIDLNPDACAALGKSPVNFMKPCSWSWA
jgi:hypothetical protein